MSIDSPNFVRRETNGKVDMFATPPFPSNLFNRMYVDYYNLMSKYTLGIVRNIPGFDYRYQDLTQETFLKAFKALPKLEEKLKATGGELNVRPWLLQIGTNLCIDEIRKARLVQMDSLEVFSQIPHPKQVSPDNPLNEVHRQEKRRLVRSALEELSPAERIVLELRYLEELSVEETAVKMQRASSNAIKGLTFRARGSFKTAYLKLDNSPEV